MLDKKSLSIRIVSKLIDYAQNIWLTSIYYLDTQFEGKCNYNGENFSPAPLQNGRL